jgi:putative two-component system response regulator
MFKRQAENRNKAVLEYCIKMAYIAEIKEWDNRQHLDRIRRYSQILANGFGLTPGETEIISTACILHDIGKTTLPEDLLKRTGNYDPSEWKVIERHTIEGALLLQGSSSPVLQAAEIITFTHHERWDGSGYPEKLKKEEIPISGRICALADVFDALTSKRSYKGTVEDAEALKLIVQSSGVLFDPKLVRVFESKYDEILNAKNLGG